MNCNVPTDICFSFTGFQARGGITDRHEDGWGIAFFEGKGVRQFLDPLPSSKSPVAELVRKYPIKSKNVIAHIRKATRGRVALENTHPFARELWGYYWIFAHNGTLENFAPDFDGEFHPVGETDSERAFCYMLQELRRAFGREYPGEKAVFDAVTAITRDLGRKGAYNFILSNGESLIAHCSTNLAYVQRRWPFPTPRLKDREMTVNFKPVTTPDDRVAVVATTPLTEGETWITMEPGTIWMMKEGEVVARDVTVPGPPPKTDEPEPGARGGTP